MTRKKTTTGTMGSKRKSDTKTKLKPVEVEKEAAPAHGESKADEVIPEVPIGLLETHPHLPEQGRLLEEFATYYRAAGERALAEARAAEAAKQAASEPKLRTDAPRKKRPTFQPPSGVSSRPQVIAAPPVEAPVEPEPSVVVAQDLEPEPSIVVAPDIAAAPAEAEPEPDASEPAPLFSLPEVGESEGIGAVMAEAETAHRQDDSIEDVFAMLEARAEKKVDDDFDFSFQTAADKSNPFLAPGSAPAADDTATRMLVGADDAEITATPLGDAALPADFELPAQEAPRFAAPHESTTLIQAMPEEEPAEGDAASRKSRKSSRKRRG